MVAFEVRAYLIALPTTLAFAFSAASYSIAHESTEAKVDATPKRVEPVEQEAAFATVRNFDDLCKLAESQAKQPYETQQDLPKVLADLDYDQYIKIKYRHEQATWANQGLPFWIETFHRGFVQRDRVYLYTLSPPPSSVELTEKEQTRSDESGISLVSPVARTQPETARSRSSKESPELVSQRLKFSTDDFEYPESIDPQTIGNIGHAGVRLVGRFPGQHDSQEILSFLGSSYFRARSANTIYGSSARGVAIDVALPKDEEFPDFRAFWIQMPATGDESITVLGFLDGPSVCGAYRFTLHPGVRQTDIDIDCQLSFRSVPEKVALAPLTSMWIWGDGLEGPPLDARPSVHDSDGLLIWQGGRDWRWRPYARQSYPSVTSLPIDELHGFGTLQRNRAFYHYDDHNARYDMRPSVWVTPSKPWKNGRIELLELPGAHEGVDNIGAYWISNEPVSTDRPLELRYTVSFFAGDVAKQKDIGRATNLSVKRSEGLAEIEVRFAGHDLQLLEEQDHVTVVSSSIRGKITSESLRRTETGDWVLRSIVAPEESGPVELSWKLTHDGKAVSEEVAYLLPDQQPTFVYPSVYTRQERAIVRNADH
ncbi:glucan biosynthesis protein [Roseiconus lacunae]|uniref:glucan biosynthesis protein n=1 Tax=Roseiconus lacunae TaxID=2605694 RepID=UPI001E4B8D6B|nr:glucan biosynthesis protein [Roseiconus lacunae]MCD0459408.1 glucan biosynthesis protein [Roseiconus lacunae]